MTIEKTVTGFNFQRPLAIFYLMSRGCYDDGFQFHPLEITFNHCYIHFMTVEITIGKRNFYKNTC